MCFVVVSNSFIVRSERSSVFRRLRHFHTVFVDVAVRLSERSSVFRRLRHWGLATSSRSYSWSERSSVFRRLRLIVLVIIDSFCFCQNVPPFLGD